MSPEPKSVVRIRIVHKINNNHISLSRLPGFMSADVLSRVFPQLLACSVTFSPRLFPTIMVLFNLAHRMEHFPKFFGFILWAHRQLLESWGKTEKVSWLVRRNVIDLRSSHWDLLLVSHFVLVWVVTVAMCHHPMVRPNAPWWLS